MHKLDLKKGITYLKTMTDRKLGYIILCFVFIVVCVILVLGYGSISQKNHIRTIAFQQIGNLRIDDQVRLKGISVGIVKNICLSKDNVFVDIQTTAQLDFHQGYNVMTMDAGIMGDRMIMIDNGPQQSPLINPTDTLKGFFTPGVSEAVGSMSLLRDVIDTLKEISERLLHGNIRSKSLIYQVNTLVRSIDSLSKKSSSIAMVLNREVTCSVDTLDKIVDHTAMISKSIAVTAPEYLDMVEAKITQAKTLLTSADSVIDRVSVLTAGLQKENNIIWGNELSNLQSTINTLHTTIATIHRDMLQFKIFLGLW